MFWVHYVLGLGLGFLFPSVGEYFNLLAVILFTSQLDTSKRRNYIYCVTPVTDFLK